MSGVRRLLVILISVVMVLTYVPLTALADDGAGTGGGAATEIVKVAESAGNLKVKNLWASKHAVGQVTF